MSDLPSERIHIQKKLQALVSEHKQPTSARNVVSIDALNEIKQLAL